MITLILFKPAHDHWEQHFNFIPRLHSCVHFLANLPSAPRSPLHRGKVPMPLEDTTEFGTTGGQLPGLFAFYGEKQLDLSGLASREQIFAVLDIELADVPDNETIVMLAVR